MTGFASMRPPVVLAGALLLLGASPAPIVQPVAGAAWTTDGVAKLASDLDQLFANSAALRSAHVGVLAVDTASGSVLYAHDADQEFQPASTFKLVAGSAALDKLGPSFRFHTTLELAMQPGSGTPSLVLRMGGDPTLATADLTEALEAVPGPSFAGVYVDDSAFERRPYPAGWTWDDFAQDYAPKLSAATLDENVVDVRVTPGANAGDPAIVERADGLPMGDPFATCNATLTASVDVVARATTGATGSDDTIDVARGPLDCPEVVGSIPAGEAPETIGAAVYSPIVAAGEALRRAVAARGFALSGLHTSQASIEAATRPPAWLVPQRILWAHDSKPLGELLGPRFWIPSDNLFAELLLEELGLATGGKPGSTEKGIAYEKTWLRSLGIDPATLTFADGCGMSQYDRITPRDLVAILQHDWNGPNRQLVLDSLPVGGARGTIEGIAGTSAAGRVFAKTGSMMHVRGLAGYLTPEHHGAVTFAFSVDDWNGDYPALAALRAQVLSRIVSD